MPWDVVSRFLFPAPQPSYGPATFPKELIFVPKILELRERCPPAQCVPCLFLPYPSARFLIFYLHSNAEDLGKCYGFCRVLREQFQVHVIAVEYPGYGMCPGGPATADSVTENAFAVFRFVREVLRWPLDSIKIFGRSIGTGPAISLAVQYKVAGLILIAPFLSIKELLNEAVGPLSYLVDERFPSKERMHLIRSPVLIIHGRKDTLIPYRHGVSLYELSHSRKLLVCPEDMEHNTNLLTNVEHFVLPMLQFFSLPDYCFEEIEIPAWVFDQRLLASAAASSELNGSPASPALRSLSLPDLAHRSRSRNLDEQGGGDSGAGIGPFMTCSAGLDVTENHSCTPWPALPEGDAPLEAPRLSSHDRGRILWCDSPQRKPSVV